VFYASSGFLWLLLKFFQVLYQKLG